MLQLLFWLSRGRRDRDGERFRIEFFGDVMTSQPESCSAALLRQSLR